MCMIFGGGSAICATRLLRRSSSSVYMRSWSNLTHANVPPSSTALFSQETALYAQAFNTGWRSIWKARVIAFHDISGTQQTENDHDLATVCGQQKSVNHGQISSSHHTSLIDLAESSAVRTVYETHRVGLLSARCIRPYSWCAWHMFGGRCTWAATWRVCQTFRLSQT